MLKKLAYTLGGVVFFAAAGAGAAVNIAVIAPEEGEYAGIWPADYRGCAYCRERD